MLDYYYNKRARIDEHFYHFHALTIIVFCWK